MKEPDPTTVTLTMGTSVKQRVVNNIQQASRTTGVSFGYLMAQAHKESSFKPEARSRTSSASGLYQFTRGTWLDLVKQHGADHGLGDLAARIRTDENGRCVVDDPAIRQQILDLRRDPQLSALMAGEYANDNKAWLEKTLGRPVDSTDLYLAHFLGPGGAAKLLEAKARAPQQEAATLVPQAARKNHAVFYDGHTPRSVASVYDRVHRAIDRPMRQFASLENPSTAKTEPASATPSTATPAQVASASGRKAARAVAKGKDAAWPFESGQWPPPLPTRRPSPPVAFTSAGQSADQISAPMPPALGAEAAVEQSGTFGKLLASVKRGLLGRA